MTVSENNKRVNVKLSKEEYSILEKLAKEQNRSISNMVHTLIINKLNDKPEK